MDWTAKGGMDTLQRIVALLLTLADLADQAAERSRGTRCRALFFLHQGEAVAYAALSDLARDFGAPVVSQPTIAPPRGGDSRADAALLALRLRALALVIAGLVSWLRKMARRQASRLGTLTSARVTAVDSADMSPAYAVAQPRIDTS